MDLENMIRRYDNSLAARPGCECKHVSQRQLKKIKKMLNNDVAICKCADTCIIRHLLTFNDLLPPIPRRVLCISCDGKKEETQEFHEWQTVVGGSKCFCHHCYLSLLPLLPQLLRHISKHAISFLSVSDRTVAAKKLLTNQTTLNHIQFCTDICRIPFIVRYILSDKSMYSHLFYAWLIMLRFVFTTQFADERKFNNNPIVRVSRNVFGENLELFLISLKREHIWFLMGNNDLKLNYFTIVTSDAVKSLSILKQSDRSANLLETGKKLLHHIHWIQSKTRQIHPKLYNQSCLGCYTHLAADMAAIMFSLPPKLPLLQYSNMLSQSELGNAFREDFEAMFFENVLVERTQILENALMIFVKPSVMCCNPECSRRRYERGAEFLETEDILEALLPPSPDGWEKLTFRKCRQCRIASYCSRTCQKIHWNKYSHKKQCILLSKFNSD